MTSLGAPSEVAPLGVVLVKRVRDAWPDESALDTWRELNYTRRPDLARAHAESEAFLAVLRGAGAELIELPRDASVGLDSLYARDAAIECARGLILCNMSKDARRTEPAALERTLTARGIPIHGRITDEGRVEGGDVVWLVPGVPAVGRGYRTNEAGIAQLARLLRDELEELIVVPLPHWRGPNDVFHLMSIISPLDRDLALVYEPLLPVPFRERLLALGFTLVGVPDEEFASLGCNALAVAPRRIVMIAGNPETRRRLEAAGCIVTEVAGQEICVTGGGGPTCLTRPLTRRAKG